MEILEKSNQWKKELFNNNIHFSARFYLLKILFRLIFYIFKPKGQICLLLYGSTALNYRSYGSDFDIFLISELTISRRYLKNIIFFLKIFTINISIRTISIKKIKYQYNSLTFWFIIFESIYILGNKSLYLKLKSEMKIKLKKFSGNDLINMYYSDIKIFRNKLDDPDANIYYNLNRGCGGIIDIKYCILVKYWFQIKYGQIPLTLFFEFLELKMNYIFLVSLKKKLSKLFCLNFKNYKSLLSYDILIFNLISAIKTRNYEITKTINLKLGAINEN